MCECVTQQRSFSLVHSQHGSFKQHSHWIQSAVRVQSTPEYLRSHLKNPLQRTARHPGNCSLFQHGLHYMKPRDSRSSSAEYKRLLLFKIKVVAHRFSGQTQLLFWRHNVHFHLVLHFHSFSETSVLWKRREQGFHHSAVCLLATPQTCAHQSVSTWPLQEVTIWQLSYRNCIHMCICLYTVTGQ